MVDLRKLNWRRDIHINNPVAAALLSKMGYTEKERVLVKKEFLRMLARMEINPAKMELIVGFYETYLSLTKSKKNKLMEEIKQLNSQTLGLKEEKKRVFRNVFKKEN